MTTLREPQGTRVAATAVPVVAYRCSACGQTGDHDAAQLHLRRFACGQWTGEPRPMNRGDGVRHLSAYYWTVGPTLTHRAICDGHPLWIIGGIDLTDCPVCFGASTIPVDVADPPHNGGQTP